MKRAWKILSIVVCALLLLAVGIPAALYVALSLDCVHTRIREEANRQLSDLLGADLYIRRLGYHPFSRLELRDVSLVLEGDTIASIERVSAGMDAWSLIRHGRWVVDYALVEDFTFNLRRDSVGAPLNIAPVLAHLASDNPDREPPAFSLALNTVILRNGKINYDVASAPPADEGRFCPSHIAVGDLSADAYIPAAGAWATTLDLEHFAFEERSGFKVDDISFSIACTPGEMSLNNLRISLPHTRLALSPLTLDLSDKENIVTNNLALCPRLRTVGPNYIYPPDLEAFVPALGDIASRMSISFDLNASPDTLRVVRFEIMKGTGARLSASLSGYVSDFDNPDSAGIALSDCRIRLQGTELAQTLGRNISYTTGRRLRQIPLVDISLSGTATKEHVTLNAALTGGLGSATADIRAMLRGGKIRRVSGRADTRNLNLGALADYAPLGRATLRAEGDYVIQNRKHIVNARLTADSISYRDHTYRGLTASVDMPSAGRGEVRVALHDASADVQAYAFFNLADSVSTLNATATAANVDFAALGMSQAHPDHRFGMKLTAELYGHDLESVGGRVALTDIRWLDRRNQGLRVPRLTLCASPMATPPSIEIYSNLIHGTISGPYTLTALPGQIGASLAKVYPTLNFPALSPDGLNEFSYEFTVEPCEEISEFLNLPIALPAPMQISGTVASPSGNFGLSARAPFLIQGDKLFEDTYLAMWVHGDADTAAVNLTTHFPTKKGPMAVDARFGAHADSIVMFADWEIQRAIPLAGRMDMGLKIKPSLPGVTRKIPLPIDLALYFNRSSINFGSDTWEIAPATIALDADRISISHLALESGNQHLCIDGTIGAETTDSVTVSLRNISLLPIFETLEIDKAMLSGTATGTFVARDLLGNEPFLECPCLHVDSIGYNRCTIGNADVLARWDNAGQGFFLDADIASDGGHGSRIHGSIYPMAEALDLNFEADRVPVGFLKPFMEAFARDIRGFASGKCRLFGTFKEVDLEGDVFAQGVSLDIDFTNSTYTATDSVHMRPGQIIVPEATLTDAEGHTARFSGWVHHEFFKRPSFRFDVTDARNILAYNSTSAQNPIWYGRIFGTGNASIYGAPGVLYIDADMSTGPGSTFTFVLSDQLEAVEYSFIEFRDVTPDSVRVALNVTPEPTEPESVRRIRQRFDNAEEDEPSDYIMDIAVDITKDAAITLVMDPASGDDIRATGTGHLRMTYESEDEDLRMYGTYSVLSGSYHFTLQDIIIKDFIIKEGSTISFDGDPYAIRANLNAYYATNANISDLDESFRQDRDVARTNVPVHALMKVSGDIRQPDIQFDLEFPTLTQDTYRKVRSIVSTEDMMNRQIIYLLALNRFYTPDYMDKTTKGNELFSVASSTLSSQLTSLLGKLNDHWSIAPNVRSDRGDFSDVEVDLALSSRLLNNRLLLNGNFGYRDKSLNTNQFIGDFDIEYLISPRGTWRLKAYNRYNDANYYLRSAATTQGVGIMYRRDFDNIFKFLIPKKRRHSSAPSAAQNDSISPQ